MFEGKSISSADLVLGLAILGLGLAVGTGIGVAIGNIGVGLATGVAFSIAFGSTIAAFRAQTAENCETGADVPDESTPSQDQTSSTS